MRDPEEMRRLQALADKNSLDLRDLDAEFDAALKRRRVARAKNWLRAFVVAAVLAGSRVLVDWLAPPHLRWWFTAAVAFSASIWTSAYWLTSRRDVR